MQCETWPKCSLFCNTTADVVLLFVGMEGASPDDPTHLKRFWSAAEGGGKYRVYEQQVNSKLVDLTVEHYSQVLVCSTVGLRTKSSLSAVLLRRIVVVAAWCRLFLIRHYIRCMPIQRS